ncbi:hypothetical protein SAY87_011473 [Trapa incisa]|uniref:DEAD-box ATP-dependent RNA helicase 39 n=1 Tax=Trapa incisa TaxID=236973 RepID=A0AAN7JBH6_9MYRT|nr:hypothetical protein SAY87_011473 [Trapa incisa]
MRLKKPCNGLSHWSEDQISSWAFFGCWSSNSSSALKEFVGSPRSVQGASWRKGRPSREEAKAAKSMRGRAGRTLLRSLNFNSKFFPSTNSLIPINGKPLQRLRHLASATKKPPPPPVNRAPETGTSRDTMILEMFRRRKLSDSRKDSGGESEVSRDGAQPTEVVPSFEELGLSKEVIRAVEEVGVIVPSEVQYLSIPAVLEGKNLVLLGPSESGRTLAYLMPIIQLLRKDAASFGLKPEPPRAVVLCPSEELCNKVFCAARFITSHLQFKSADGVDCKGMLGDKEDSSPAPIGMLVGTPEEILQQIKDQDIILRDTRYFVLDEADSMLVGNIFMKIQKIFSLLESRAAEHPSFQTILVASSNDKVLGNELVRSLEQKGSGKVTAVILEMDQAEVPGIFESPDALTKKVTEAVRSLATAP